MFTTALVVDRRLCVVAPSVVLNVISLCTLKGSTWSNLVIFTYTKRESGSGFTGVRCCRGRTGGSGEALSRRSDILFKPTAIP